MLCLTFYSGPMLACGAIRSGWKPPTGSSPQSRTIDSNRSASAQLPGEQFTVEYN